MTGPPAAGEGPRIGVLALQGDFAAHLRALEEAGGTGVEVRTRRDLRDLQGLILPGGESTTLLKLMRPERLDEAVAEFHQTGGALFGTCAGLILLARKVANPEQEGLGLCDIDVRRNGYGRQVDSFVGSGSLALPGEEETEAEVVFIRAPRISRIGPGVSVLGRHGEEPVLVAEGRVLAATFHPEMSRGNRLHRWFLRLAAEPVRSAHPAGGRPESRPGPGESGGLESASQGSRNQGRRADCRGRTASGPES
jgi:pyridoxal 5'-phosphate synthase pdxT subunit